MTDCDHEGKWYRVIEYNGVTNYGFSFGNVNHAVEYAEGITDYTTIVTDTSFFGFGEGTYFTETEFHEDMKVGEDCKYYRNENGVHFNINYNENNIAAFNGSRLGGNYVFYRK